MYFVLAKQNSLQEVLSCVSVFSLSSPSTLESYRGPPCLALSGKNAYNSHQTTKKKPVVHSRAVEHGFSKIG